MKRIVLAVTGSSGAPIGLRILETLLSVDEVELSLVMSDNARLTSRLEAGIELGKSLEDLDTAVRRLFAPAERLKVYDAADMAARISSGSHMTAGMIIAPCSMSTLSAIATGVTMNLVHRAASVMLKEKRPLVLVPRESPLSPVHLKNMLELSQYGVHIVPATLAFYNKPGSVQELIDFTCARVLDLLGIPHGLSKRWEGDSQKSGIHTRIQGYLG